MLEQAEVLSQWVSVTVEQLGLVRTPLVGEVYDVTTKDLTNQLSASIPPDPNNYVVRITADTATMDLIAADPDYTILEGTRHGV
jgi:hypothetical protein